MNKYITILLTIITVACAPNRESPTETSTLSAPKIDRDAPIDYECPNRQNTTGIRVGDTFPMVQFPNAEWEPVNIKTLCGASAILVVTATEWCGSCLVEFDYLAMVAPDWKTRGVEIYFTLFENSAGHPATSNTLINFELYMLDIYGSIPFPVLADPSAMLPRSLGGGVLLPITWALDREMVVTNFSEGTNSAMITEWVDTLLTTPRPPASPTF